MIINIKYPFDLESTLFSGQVFRWRRLDGWYFGVIYDHIVKIKQIDNGIEVYCDNPDEFFVSQLLSKYFNLDLDIDEIYKKLPNDEFIQNSIKKYQGMRILKQDPWECLISFICSSVSNIKRISKNIEDLCINLGDTINLGSYSRQSFPKPEDIVYAGSKLLRELKLGFRSEYIYQSAKMIACGELDLNNLYSLSYDESLRILVSFPGVGDKVANCVLLFGFNKLDAFPVDVWINRAITKNYLKGETLSPLNIRDWSRNHFGDYAGYANHYIFHGIRLQDQNRPDS